MSCILTITILLPILVAMLIHLDVIEDATMVLLVGIIDVTVKIDGKDVNAIHVSKHA